MSSVVQYGRRRGSSKRVSSAEEGNRMIQPPDLQQVTVLTKSDWMRIQEELNMVNKDQESMREAAKQKEALHLKSQEVVKLWSNTIAGQRQKQLEAKKIRQQIEEEKRKQTDIEEAKYRAQQREEAIEKAKNQLFHQTDRVKGLHGALLLTEVLKEREAQVELKQRIKKASDDVDREILNKIKTREEEALRQEQEKALQKKLGRQALVEGLKNQVKENEQAKERLKEENKKDGEQTQRLQELHQQEQSAEEERHAKLRRDLMRAHMEHVHNKDLIKATDQQRQEADEEQRKLFLSAKQKMIKLRKDKERELFGEAQLHKEEIMNKLVVSQQGKTAREEQRTAKARAEQEAKQEQQQREEEQKKAEMMESIAAHRELVRKEKEQRDKSTKQDTRDTLEAKKEADRIFSEKQQLKAQRMREDERKLQDFRVAQTAKRAARHQQLRREDHELAARNAELTAEEEDQFQRYSRRVIGEAAEAQRNVFPLCKAAAGGLGAGGHALTNSYLVQDLSGAPMPKYVSAATRNVKKLNEAKDIQDAKKRLGFTWS
uniref:Cilia and flagella associated protein 210 n=1 Tax=Gasterosteus aculeatus aculeatus TaxID=481459 RepID=G3NN98_GASAC|nr:coiled-coil domain-containing protein 173 [Gasterosteus aculeatus aculeatus]